MILLQKNYNGRETWKAMQASISMGIKYDFGTSSDYREGMTPVGSVEFCQACLEWIPARQIYPLFLEKFFHRKIEVVTALEDVSYSKDVFVKPLYYKEFKPFVLKKGDKLPIGNYYISDVVEFVNEWRLYISAGKVLTYGWYDGIIEDKPLPKIEVNWPKDFYGAVDFGELIDGRIALVESHHPYACGWYGEDHENYLQWLIEGWKYVKTSVFNQRHRQVPNIQNL